MKVQLTSFDASYLKNFFDMMEASTDMYAWVDDFEVDDASFEMMVAAYHTMKAQL